MLLWGHQKSQGYFFHWKTIISKRWTHLVSVTIPSPCKYLIIMNCKKNKYCHYRDELKLLGPVHCWILTLVSDYVYLWLFLECHCMMWEREILTYAFSYECPLRERVNFFRKKKVSDNYLQVIVQFCVILRFSNKHTKCFISQSFLCQAI